MINENIRLQVSYLNVKHLKNIRFLFLKAKNFVNLISPFPRFYFRITMKESQFKNKDGFKLTFDENCSKEDKEFFVKKYPNVDYISQTEINCTSCNKIMGSNLRWENKIRTHKILGVTQCVTCYDFYVSILFIKNSSINFFLHTEFWRV